jgi:ABC-2 type transport system permease protein
MRQIFKDALIIARRDFFSIVATPTFLLFLLAPMFMIAFGLVGGLGAAQMGKAAGAKREIAAIVSPADAAVIKASDARMRRVASIMIPKLKIVSPAGNGEKQAEAIMASKESEVSAVLYGPLETPHIVYQTVGGQSGNFLAELADRSVRARSARLFDDKDVSKPVRIEIKVVQPRQSGQAAAGYGAVFLIFLLTLMLSGQAAGTLAEEKGNKVIEILAAAVRLESVFFGKLIGLFGVALVFVAFWTSLAALGLMASPIKLQDILADYTPAIGLPLFFFFGILYFTMQFMLLGAVFLGMGGLASSMREVQMMSLPITALQVGMFGISNAAASNPGSGIARFAEIFPFSSPMAMAARGGTDPSVLPHFLALGWQGLWVALVIYGASKLFRRGVLKSGSGPAVFRRKPKIATNG